MKRTASKRPQFLATRQWNHIVTSFQDQVPMKPVRHRLKLYANCFTGTQAVAWLKQFFLESGAYGNITTAQVEKFCQKLLEMGIVVDATRIGKGNRKYSESSSRPFAHGPHPYCLAEAAQAARVARKDGEAKPPLRRSESVKSTQSAGGSAAAAGVPRDGSDASLYSGATGLPVRRSTSVPSSVDNRIVCAPQPPQRPQAFKHGTVAASDSAHSRIGGLLSYMRKTAAIQSMVAVGSLDDVINMLDDESKESGDDKENCTLPRSSFSMQMSPPLSSFPMQMSPPLSSFPMQMSPPLSSFPMQMSPPAWTANGGNRPVACTDGSFPAAFGRRGDSPPGCSPRRLAADDAFSRRSSSGSSTNSCIPAAGHPPSSPTTTDGRPSSPASTCPQPQPQPQQPRRHTLERTVLRPSQSLPYPQVAPPLPRRQYPGIEVSRSMTDQQLSSRCCGRGVVATGSDAFVRSSDTWKEVVLSRLLQCVEIPTLEAIIHCVLVDGNHIAVNCGYPAENSAATAFVPLAVLLEKRRRSWPSKAYPQIVSPLFECEWSGVHAMCPRSSSGVNISYTPLICSAMDRLAYWPSKNAKTCCEFWLERGIEDIIPTIAQHFRRVVDGTVIPREFFPLFIAVHPLLAKKRSMRSIEALQHCVLLLPPARRVLLERILVFLATCHENQKLVLDPAEDNIDVLLSALVPALLQQKRGSSSKQAVDIIGFMAINVAEICRVPRGVIEEMQHCQCVDTEDDLSSVDSGVHGGYPESASSAPTTSNISESSLLQLLDVIITGTAMTDNERRRRLKEFKKVYPNLYGKRFSLPPRASSTSCPDILDDKADAADDKVAANKRRSSSMAGKLFAGVRLHRSFKIASAFPRSR